MTPIKASLWRTYLFSLSTYYVTVTTRRFDISEETDCSNYFQMVAVMLIKFVKWWRRRRCGHYLFHQVFSSTNGRGGESVSAGEEVPARLTPSLHYINCGKDSSRTGEAGRGETRLPGRGPVMTPNPRVSCGVGSCLIWVTCTNNLCHRKRVQKFQVFPAVT